MEERGAKRRFEGEYLRVVLGTLKMKFDVLWLMEDVKIGKLGFAEEDDEAVAEERS